MAIPLTVLPNDGPVMRWALEHAKHYLLNLSDRHSFDDDVSQFRYCRDIEKPYGTEERCIKIDGLAGTIEMIGGHHSYEFNILMPGAWISESFIRKAIRGDGPAKQLAISAHGQAPTALLDSFIGDEVDRLIQLPKDMQSIIEGRTVLTAKQVFDDTITVNLSGDPS